MSRGYFGIGVFHPKTEENVGTLWRHARLYGASFIFTIGRRYRKQPSDTSDNRVENLEWATHSENERHAHANGKTVWNKGRFGIPAHKPRLKTLKANLTQPKE